MSCEEKLLQEFALDGCKCGDVSQAGEKHLLQNLSDAHHGLLPNGRSRKDRLRRSRMFYAGVCTLTERERDGNLSALEYVCVTVNTYVPDSNTMLVSTRHLGVATRTFTQFWRQLIDEVILVGMPVEQHRHHAFCKSPWREVKWKYIHMYIQYRCMHKVGINNNTVHVHIMQTIRQAELHLLDTECWRKWSHQRCPDHQHQPTEVPTAFLWPLPPPVLSYPTEGCDFWSMRMAIR